MKPIDKVSVMARLSTINHKWSDYGHINVSFSLVKAANYFDTPEFIGMGDDVPKSLNGIGDLLITSQVSAADVVEKGMINSHYGYRIGLDLNQPSLGFELEQAIKAGKRVQKRIAKLNDSEGSYHNIADYLRYVFRAMNVKYTTNENYSERRFNQRWKGYKAADLPVLIEQCTEELSENLGWHLPLDQAV